MIPDEEREYFARGKQVLGQSAGGLLARLLKAKQGCVPMARAVVEMAATKQDPREWVSRVAGPKPTITGKDVPGYVRHLQIKAAELDERERPMDRSSRPTLEELQSRYGPRWGLGGSPQPTKPPGEHKPTEHGARVKADLAERATRACSSTARDNTHAAEGRSAKTISANISNPPGSP